MRLSTALPKEKTRSGQSDGADDDRVFEEVGVGHQREADEHRFPKAHPLAVDETNEADAAEEQSC